MRDQGRVRLRDVSADDIALIDAWDADPVLKGEFNDFGQPPHSIRQDFEAGKIVGDDHGLLVVERVADAAPIGTVSWRAVHYGPPPDSRAWQIGIALVPEGRGQGDAAGGHSMHAHQLCSSSDALGANASWISPSSRKPIQNSLNRSGGATSGRSGGAGNEPSCGAGPSVPVPVQTPR